MDLRSQYAPVLLLVLVLGACGSLAPVSQPAPTQLSPESTQPAPPSVPTLLPGLDTDGTKRLTAFLDATYTPRAAGDWYRGGGVRALAGRGVTLEFLVKGSTPAEALAHCPLIARAAAYFLHGFDYRISLAGRIDVRTGNAVTFKSATFPDVDCPTMKSAPDPVRATIPGNATDAAARLSSFLDDYLRMNGWFIGAIHHVGPNGTQSIAIEVSGAPARRCAVLRAFANRFLGRFRAQLVVTRLGGASITC